MLSVTISILTIAKVTAFTLLALGRTVLDPPRIGTILPDVARPQSPLPLPPQATVMAVLAALALLPPLLIPMLTVSVSPPQLVGVPALASAHLLPLSFWKIIPLSVGAATAAAALALLVPVIWHIVPVAVSLVLIRMKSTVALPPGVSANLVLVS